MVGWGGGGGGGVSVNKNFSNQRHKNLCHFMPLIPRIESKEIAIMFIVHTHWIICHLIITSLVSTVSELYGMHYHFSYHSYYSR